jgi:hypothetical protein
MNRKIKKHLENIRIELNHIDAYLNAPEEPEEEVTEEEINVTSAHVLPTAGLYLDKIKELSSLKDVEIVGQITKTFDLKSYIKKDQTGTGMLYRFVLTDPTDEITVICFDDMAKEFKKYPIGTYLRITNVWKIQDNKHGIAELHVGNFAKIEVVE